MLQNTKEYCTHKDVKINIQKQNSYLQVAVEFLKNENSELILGKNNFTDNAINYLYIIKHLITMDNNLFVS